MQRALTKFNKIYKEKNAIIFVKCFFHEFTIVNSDNPNIYQLNKIIFQEFSLSMEFISLMENDGFNKNKKSEKYAFGKFFGKKQLESETVVD